VTAIERNRRLALVVGIAIPALQTGRVLLWGRAWPEPLQWPIALDAFVAGAVLLWGVALAGRDAAAGLVLLGVGWGFSCGAGYRSLVEQLADPARHGGHEILVMAVKALMVAVVVAGAVRAVKAAPAPPGRS
jgi:hypothetical protein